jgi:hypothetical protein
MAGQWAAISEGLGTMAQFSVLRRVSYKILRCRIYAAEQGARINLSCSLLHFSAFRRFLRLFRDFFLEMFRDFWSIGPWIANHEIR